MQRYSGYVITLLPVGLAALLFLISPSYITVMLQKPPELLGLPTGIIFFIVGPAQHGRRVRVHPSDRRYQGVVRCQPRS